MIETLQMLYSVSVQTCFWIQMMGWVKCYFFLWVPVYVGLKGNELADRTVNKKKICTVGIQLMLNRCKD